MLHLAMKAFYPENRAVPVYAYRHNSGSLADMIKFRDDTAKKLGIGNDCVFK